MLKKQKALPKRKRGTLTASIPFCVYFFAFCVAYMRQKSPESGSLICSKGTSSTASDLVQTDEIYQKLPKSNKKKGVCRPIVESGFITRLPTQRERKGYDQKVKADDRSRCEKKRRHTLADRVRPLPVGEKGSIAVGRNTEFCKEIHRRSKRTIFLTERRPLVVNGRETNNG